MLSFTSERTSNSTHAGSYPHAHPSILSFWDLTVRRGPEHRLRLKQRTGHIRCIRRTERVRSELWGVDRLVEDPSDPRLLHQFQHGLLQAVCKLSSLLQGHQASRKAGDHVPTKNLLTILNCPPPRPSLTLPGSPSMRPPTSSALGNVLLPTFQERARKAKGTQRSKCNSQSLTGQLVSVLQRASQSGRFFKIFKYPALCLPTL